MLLACATAIVLWVAALVVACSRRDSAAPPSPVTPAVGSNEAGAGSAPTILFSRPIAASHLADGSTVVAGLVVPSSAIVATRFGEGGGPTWSVPVLEGVTWSAGSELRVLPSPDGAAVVWRGSRAGKSVIQLARVGTAGDVRGAAIDVGAATCAVDDAVAWFEHGADGTTRVRTRPWSGAVATDLVTLAADRDPELVCGAHRLFALGEGDDDVTLSSASGLDAGAPVPILRDRDFEHDEEREHDVYTVGDAFGIVRVGESGTLSVREIAPAMPAMPAVAATGSGAWRTLATKVTRDEDVVTVDADRDSVVIVFTREESDGCAGASGLSVHAVRATRAPAADGGVHEVSVELSPTICDHDLGPFSTGAVDRAFVVAWVERAHKGVPDAAPPAPISGLAWRALPVDPDTEWSALAPGATQRIEVGSDELVSAGCDRTRCYAAALVRPPGSDGMQPEPIRILTFP